MSNLVAPHGKEEKLMPLLLEGGELNAFAQADQDHIKGEL